MKIDLSNQVALITGASGDLGRVIARTFAECGADVAVHYHSDESSAREVCAKVEALGRRAFCVQADVTREADVLRMRDAVGAALGAPHIVVCNAVIQYSWTNVLTQPVADFESQFRSCVLHAALMAQAFVPAMQARRSGRFLAVNTECAVQCLPNQGAYAAGKRGLDGVMRVLAREVGPDGITVNQVAPGWMISERDRSGGTESQPGYEKNVPLRRRGDDQDIANALAFLASKQAAFITGAFLPVCGGNVMPGI